MEHLQYTSEQLQLVNRAFLFGDTVKVSFFIKNSKLVLAEECYFFLMASMRKMRMAIPLGYTLEFFQDLFQQNSLNQGVEEGIINFMVYRKPGTDLVKSGVEFYFDVTPMHNTFSIQKNIELDVMKEIHLNANLLSNIRVHSSESIYAEIYAHENDLDDVILLNPSKRVARTAYGNLLFLEGNTIKISKQTEGAYISPLMENFVTFVHKNQLAEIQQAEIIAFETQKADEVLMISDEKGVFSVSKIRNKIFSNEKFTQMVTQWESSIGLV